MILLVLISAQMKNFESAGQSDVDSFDIATVGDIGCRSGGETISSIDSTSPDVVLFLGDLSYVDQFDERNDNDDIKCFFDDTSSLTNESKVLIALGNHDIGQKYVTETTKRMLVAHFDIPVKGYYSQIFDQGRILVLVMNYTGLIDKYRDYVLEGSDQYDFVKKTLEESNATYKIVASHAPFVSEDCDGCHEPLDGIYNAYHDLFRDTGVNLVLSGHNHNYQRIEDDGITYIISGLGGARQYDISEQANTFSDPHGFLHLVFSNQSIDAKYIPNDGATKDEEFKIDASP
jgi:predicted MPP superfamily phosphohydrolase